MIMPVKKSRIVIFILVLSTLAFTLSPLEATYHVDPGGSDSTGDGSLLKPWGSIRFAAAQLSAGDTLMIHPGVYSGGIYVNVSGTEAEPVQFIASGPGVVIEGSGAERDAFFIENADYVTLDGLTIQHAERAGLRISLSHHVTVRNSTFANNGRWGVFTDFSDYTLVEDSESYGAGLEHGIYISNSSDYPTIRRNRLHHNHACGLHMNGDASMGGDGVISHGLVEKNTVYENGAGGGSGLNMDGVTDTIIRNNLLYNNHASGISLYHIDGGSDSQNNQVLNNTILMPADGRWGLNIPDTRNKLFNNIVYSAHNWRGGISVETPIDPGFESEYNIVIDQFSTDGGDTRITLAQWQALGYDTHSLIAAPAQLFVNPPTADYHLKTTSPAIDHGLLLDLVTEDLDGNPRPAGSAHDIGAYEFIPFTGDQRLYLPSILNTP